MAHVTQYETRTADASFAGKKYLFATFTANNGVAIAGAGGMCNGITSEDEVASGKAASIAVAGSSWLVVDGNIGAIAVGDRLKSDAAGKGIKTVIAADEYGAIAKEASTAAGDIIAVTIVSPTKL